MKKALVVLLAVALVFSFATTAFAFTDISAEKAATQSAINRFAAYGVVNGYDDGTFLPGGTITRAEFAKIVIAYTGNEVLAESLKNVASQFSDVKTGEWYTGWINAAVALGYFQGMGDGSFGVSKTVTYGQVVTVLLRLAGYTDALAGVWPYNYVAQATKANIGLVQAATAFDATAPATRRDVVLMASKLLGVGVVAYSENSKIFVPVTDTADNVITVGAANGVFVTEANDTLLTVEYNATKKALTVAGKVMSENFGISDGFTLFDLAQGGFKGKIMVNDKDEIVFVELGGKYVKGVAAYKGTPKVFTVDGVEYKLAETVIGNTPAQANGKYVYVTLTNKEVSGLGVIDAQGGNIVKKASTSGKSFDLVGGGTITTVDKNKVFTVFKDGVLASVEDIKVGDLVAAPTLINNDHYTYVVTSPVGAAAIESISSALGEAVDSYVIGGVTYTAPLQTISGTKPAAALTVDSYTTGKLKGVEGTFYKDAFGYPVYMVYGDTAPTSSTVIGAVVDGTPYQSTGGGTSVGTGATATYAGYSDLTVLTTAGETVTYAIDKDDVKFKVADLTKIYVDLGTIGTIDTADILIEKGVLVELTVNAEGVVIGIADAAAPTSAEVTAVDSKYSTVTIGTKKYNAPADTPVFMATMKEGVIDTIKVAALSDLGTNVNGKHVCAVLEDASSVAYFYVEGFNAVVDSTVFAVLDTLYYDGKNVKFADGTVYAQASSFAAGGAVAGDIVSYTLTNGKVSALTVKQPVSSITSANADNVDAVSGNVVIVNGKNCTIGDKLVVYIYKDGKFVEMGSAADIVKDAKIMQFDKDTADIAFADNDVLAQVIVVK